MRQSLQQKLNQKLAPAQIQLMQLIQIPGIDIEDRIMEEIASNPALEIFDPKVEEPQEIETSVYDEVLPEHETYDEIQASASEGEATNHNTYDYYEGQSQDTIVDPFATKRNQESFYDMLLQQLDMQDLNDFQKHIATYIIGNIDEDGYLRRTALEMSDDLAFKENIIVSDTEIQDLIHLIQGFEPIGVAAYDLQECLILQLQNKENRSVLEEKALAILKEDFQSFSRKHFDKLATAHDLSEVDLKSVLEIITHLSPKPGWQFDNNTSLEQSGNSVYPDFVLTIDQGKIQVLLNDKHTPQLRLAPDFEMMLEQLEDLPKRNKEEQSAVQFMKKNIDAAKIFIDAIQQRKTTLLMTMNAIAQKQKVFLISGNTEDLKPMILKDIAEIVGMDISTISRVSNSKFVQTPHGIFPLKYFFTTAYVKEDGNTVSKNSVTNILQEIVNTEDKRNPFSDQQLEALMKEKGFPIARRTVSKYRDQLNIPAAQYRKEL